MDKRIKKMSADEVQNLLAFRKRGYVQKNKKAYSRKIKHKEREVA